MRLLYLIPINVSPITEYSSRSVSQSYEILFFPYYCLFIISLKNIFQAKLANADDEAWKDREAAVLALGAIGEGCINGLYPHLSEVMPSDISHN